MGQSCTLFTASIDTKMKKLDFLVVNATHISPIGRTHVETIYGLSGLSGDDIRLFVSTVNRSLEQADADLSRRIQERAESMTEEGRQELYNDSADESITLMVCVPFVNRALLITAYTYFEDSLKQICKEVCVRGLSNRSVPNRNFGILQARDYLKPLTVGPKAFNIDVLGPGWSEINDGWRYVRNNLVHDNAEVESSMVVLNGSGSFEETQVEEAAGAEKIRDFVEDRVGLCLVEGELVVDAKAVEEFLITAEDVIDNIRSELDRIAPPPVPARAR